MRTGKADYKERTREGKVIQGIRERLNLSIRQMAYELEYDHGNLCRVETGSRSLSKLLIDKIFETYSLTEDEKKCLNPKYQGERKEVEEEDLDVC